MRKTSVKEAKTVQVPIHEVSEKRPVNKYLPYFKILACFTSLPLAIFNIDIIISILYMRLYLSLQQHF